MTGANHIWGAEGASGSTSSSSSSNSSTSSRQTKQTGIRYLPTPMQPKSSSAVSLVMKGVKRNLYEVRAEASSLESSVASESGSSM